MPDLGPLIDNLTQWVMNHLGAIGVTLVVSGWAGPPVSRLLQEVFDGAAQLAAAVAKWIHALLAVLSTLPEGARDGLNARFDAVFKWPWRTLTGVLEWAWLRRAAVLAWSPEFARIPDQLVGAALGAVRPKLTAMASGLADAYATTLANLRGKQDASSAQRVIGALLLGLSLVAFLYADLVIGIETFWGVFYRNGLPEWATALPEWVRDPATGHLVASTATALAVGFVLLDLLGVTQLNQSLETLVDAPPRSIRGVTRWVLVVLALALIALVARVVYLVSFWRARAIIAGILGRDVEPEAISALTEGLTLTIPLMVLATAFIGVSATTLPTLLWLVFIGLLRLVLGVLGALFNALAAAQVVVTPIVLLVLRALLATVLAGVLIAAAAALVGSYAALLLPAGLLGLTLLTLLTSGVLVVIFGYIAAFVLNLVGGLRFELRLVLGPVEIQGLAGLAGALLRSLLRIVATPFVSVYNWLCEFELVGKLHLRPIRFPEDGAKEAPARPESSARRVAEPAAAEA